MAAAFKTIKNLNESASNKTIDKLSLDKKLSLELENFRKNYRLTAHKDVKESSFDIRQISSTNRSLLFEHEGRPGDSKKSLFEEILETKNMSPLIHVIWDEYELWRKEIILTTVTFFYLALNEFF
jgi:hypothetical protein